ncbi:MAG: PAS domain S-box protein, partial [Gallionellaceae bacterium]|nr:PAS domain S-box protein [Gallionellaceae bacterium]
MSLLGLIVTALLTSGTARALTSSRQSTDIPAVQVQKDTLIVGSEQDYLPFATGMTDTTAGGFTVDLWRAVAAEVGLNYTIRVRPFHQILQEFKEGKIDVLINLAQSSERHRFADFTVPHAIVHGAIFVRKGNANIRSEDDLSGKSIIVIKADLAHDYAVSKGWEKQLVLIETAENGLRLLASGKHDAMLLSKLAGMQTLQALKLRNIEALKFKAGFSQKFAFAVPEGQSELLGKINEGLAATKSDEIYDQLYDKWFGLYEAKEVGLYDVLKYLIPIVLLFLGIAGYFFYRRQIERKEAGEKYRDLYDRAPDMFLSVEAKTARIIDCNQTLLDATGYSREEIVGHSVFELYHPDSANIARAMFQKFIDTKELHGVELQVQRKDGSKIDVSLNATAVCNANGVILHSRSALRDITERKQIEIELRDSEERFRQLFEKAPIGIAMAKQDQKIFIANPAFCRMFGYTQEELSDMTVIELTHPEHVALTRKMVKGVLDGELPVYSLDKKYIRKNGEMFW